MPPGIAGANPADFWSENSLGHSLWSSLERLMEGKRLWELPVRENDALIGN
jgi:hypothetical protein